MMASEKKTSVNQPLDTEEKPNFHYVVGDCGQIDPEIIRKQTEYIKIRQRSEHTLEFWNHYKFAETYDEQTREDIARIALIDLLHQQQLQRRAIKAGIIDKPFDTINEEFKSDYEYLRKSDEVSPVIDANVHGEFKSNYTDVERGYPALQTFKDGHSYIASIDRWPATLLSRKMCRHAYEDFNKPVMISGLPELYERQGIEGEDLTHSVLKPQISDGLRAGINERKAAYKPIVNPSDAKFPAHFWTIENIKQTPFTEAMFRLGDDDDGNTMRAKLKVFLQYLSSNQDDAPLYLFEDNMKREPLSAQITSLYRAPSYFERDLVTDVLEESSRPPYQWLLVGAKRSGTRMHLDPRCTSAWNHSTCGRKRWILFRPGVPTNVAKGHIVMTKEEREYLREKGNPQAVYWFTHILPRLRNWVANRERKRELKLRELAAQRGENVDSMYNVNLQYNNGRMFCDDADGVTMWSDVTVGDDFGIHSKYDAENSEGLSEEERMKIRERNRALHMEQKIEWNELEHGYGMIECIQYPQQVIYVPSGWYHAVVNIDDTIAQTQNFAYGSNFPLVWRNMRRFNKRTTRRWLRAMDKMAPEYAQLARDIDAHDGFVLSPFKKAKTNHFLSARSDSDESVSDSESSEADSDFVESDQE